MKTLPLVLLLASCASSAETLTTEMYCDKTETIFKSLRNQYNESPIITGKATDAAGSIMTFWINTETKTWSIIATKDNTSCIVGVGENFNVLSYDKKDKTIKYY